MLQFRGVERPLGPEGPLERPAADRQIDTPLCRVHVCTPAGQRTAKIGNDASLDHHHTQQTGLARMFPAAHAGAFGACSGACPARHCLSLPPHTG